MTGTTTTVVAAIAVTGTSTTVSAFVAPSLLFFSSSSLSFLAALIGLARAEL